MSITLFKNAVIYTPIDKGRPLCGSAQGELISFDPGALLVADSVIKMIGNQDDVIRAAGSDLEKIHDCAGRLIIPGFVDPHTHSCFANLREEEFQSRLQGTPYLEILKQGGGILSSVRSVRQTGVEELFANTRKHVMQALALGTTTMEIKSGYGLDTKNELKMLEVIGRIDTETPLDIVATFLGAHAVPMEYKARADDYISLVISEMLPAIINQGIAKQCDVFCERGVFSIEQGRRLLQSAIDKGMKVKLHADEVHDLGGAALAAELRAISADHLLAASKTNIGAMARAGVVANLLPATAYSLQKPYARARDLIDSNVPVALATDLNPGSSFTESMQFIIGLAVLNMKMSPAEALTAGTLNGAYSIGMADKVGSLDIGKQADFLIVDGKSPAIFAYHGGVSSVGQVYKKGVKVAG